MASYKDEIFDDLPVLTSGCNLGASWTVYDLHEHQKTGIHERGFIYTDLRASRTRFISSDPPDYELYVCDGLSHTAPFMDRPPTDSTLLSLLTTRDKAVSLQFITWLKEAQ